MKKLISLAQVEQLIEGMRTEIKLDEEFKWANWFLDARWSTACAYLIELKSKLSSLPTEESGWIAVKDIEMLQRYNHWYEYDVTDMVESDTWEYVRYESLKLLPKPPLQ